jgi:hypothetical protein
MILDYQILDYQRDGRPLSLAALKRAPPVVLIEVETGRRLCTMRASLERRRDGPVVDRDGKSSTLFGAISLPLRQGGALDNPHVVATGRKYLRVGEVIVGRVQGALAVNEYRRAPRRLVGVSPRGSR